MLRLVRLILLVGLICLPARPGSADMLLTGVGAGPASGVCSQATNFLARTSSLDGTHTTAYTNLICGLVTDGVWSKIDILFVFATQNSTTALLNLPSATYTASVTGSPVFTTDRGYTGDGVGGRVCTTFNPSTAGGNYTQNAAHTSAWNVSTTPSNEALIDDGSNIQLYPDFSGGLYTRVNDGDGSVANSTSNGHFIGNRTSSSSRDSYRNGSSLGTVTSTAGALANAVICALTNPSGGGTGNLEQVAEIGVGGTLSSTDASNLYSRLRTYMTAVGVP